jgi:hypothetical protein
MGKPSLICDSQELYRYLVEDLLIPYFHKRGKEDFIMKNEDFSMNLTGKREYLNDSLTHSLAKALPRMEPKLSRPIFTVFVFILVSS